MEYYLTDSPAGHAERFSDVGHELVELGAGEMVRHLACETKVNENWWWTTMTA